MSREYGRCENHENMCEMAISNNKKVNVLGKESMELGLDHISLTPDLAWFLLTHSSYSPQNFIELQAWFLNMVPHNKCLLSTLYRGW